jgi:hypothetical protein
MSPRQAAILINEIGTQMAMYSILVKSPGIADDAVMEELSSLRSKYIYILTKQWKDSGIPPDQDVSWDRLREEMVVQFRVLADYLDPK